MLSVLIVIPTITSKEIKPVNPKSSQPWIFTGRTDAETETPIFWPPDVKSKLIRKDLDAEKDWGRRKRGRQRMRWLGCHHWLNGHEFKQILGDSEGQGSLVCCSSWGQQESDMTEQLSNKALGPFCFSVNSLWLLLIFSVGFEYFFLSLLRALYILLKIIFYL